MPQIFRYLFIFIFQTILCLPDSVQSKLGVQQIGRGEREERGEGRVQYAGPSHQVCQGATLQGPPPVDNQIAEPDFSFREKKIFLVC